MWFYAFLKNHFAVVKKCWYTLINWTLVIFLVISNPNCLIIWKNMSLWLEKIHFLQKKSIIKKLKLWQRKDWFCHCESACFCVSRFVYLLLCVFVCANVSTRINVPICLYVYVLLFVCVAVYESAKICKNWFKSYNSSTQKYNCTQYNKHVTHMYNMSMYCEPV